ncbi:MAG: AI-2E family transporter [Rhodospirillaceae bacterium]|nr:AI-2E family transporter [Rhodospirillaceae bacterium]
MQPLRDWFRRHFSNRQVVILTTILVVATLVIVFFADMLVPVIAAVVIAYLLQGFVSRLEGLGLGHTIAAWIVFLAFMAFFLVAAFGLLPLLFRQMTQLLQQIPLLISEAQHALLRLPEQYPDFITVDQVRQFTMRLRTELVLMTQALVSYSVSSIVAVITAVVYLILVPVLVFFFVKDRSRIVAWLTGFLPSERQLTTRVWSEVNAQIGNYVRGKFLEILIVGVVTYVVFGVLGLRYALLLSVLTGFSVLIPYVGATAVTLPVAAVAYLQYGFTAPFTYALIAYGVIQALDGNLLAPLLLGEAVNIHPVAIIVAILFFGGLWGFWGVFFAIPLATVVNAVLRAWPKPPAGSPPPAP